MLSGSNIAVLGVPSTILQAPSFCTVQ